ncbi:MAG: RnfABCDGE type electron transport complex subunit C, partial [Angelakisella sp.]
AARECGLVGLGGAGFPTHIKFNPKNLSEVDTLVVNGAECEPYITCDMRLMLEDTQGLLDGISAVKKYMEIGTVIIAIEENKPEAIAKLTEACKGMDGVTVKALKAKYPQGAEKVLIYECTGRVVGEGKLPADVGAIVSNVATLAKLADYLKTGMPLVEKMLTVDGSAIAEPKNIIAPIGTSIADMIAFCGGYRCDAKKILMGGPMMGISVPSDEYPLLKNNNAILAFDEKDAEQAPESACIKCGACLRACPFNLAPASIDKAYHAGNTDALKKLKVNLCMECGCCSYVCPAKRDLVMSNKLGKQLLREQKN